MWKTNQRVLIGKTVASIALEKSVVVVAIVVRIVVGIEVANEIGNEVEAEILVAEKVVAKVRKDIGDAAAEVVNDDEMDAVKKPTAKKEPDTRKQARGKLVMLLIMQIMKHEEALLIIS